MRVAVLGGGVGGLSAAQELVERGFDVAVYERRDAWGGKARSTTKPGTGRDGRDDLPGEHGFRFFPRFYRHLPNTMSRIPFTGNDNGAAGNLSDTERVDISCDGKVPLPVMDRAPRNLGEVIETLRGAMELGTEASLKPGEVEFFAGRLWRILTSCEERRFAEYEKQGWWEFIGAEERSDGYKKFLAIGLTRSLVAAHAKQSNAKATGDILVQLLLGMGEPGVSTDRVLCGPTNEVWIDPWVAYLESKGVALHGDRAVTALEFAGGRITGATLTGSDGSVERADADFYVLAVPVEVAARLFGDPSSAPIVAAAPELALLPELAADVAWMNGLQFYLRRDVPVARGHILFLDSPWAITAISQQQFWPNCSLSAKGDGTVKGILSVDISDWTVPGTFVKTPANDSSVEEIIDEVWREMLEGLNTDTTVLSDADLHSWYLDPDIGPVAPKDRVIWDDAEPLFLSLIDTWRLRPDAATSIPNLLLASDYVRTNTQLPTMEGANEGARRAVNAILKATASAETPCQIWPLHEPEMFALFRWYDQWRFRHGRPWREVAPALVRVGHYLVVGLEPVLRMLRNWRTKRA